MAAQASVRRSDTPRSTARSALWRTNRRTAAGARGNRRNASLCSSPYPIDNTNLSFPLRHRPRFGRERRILPDGENASINRDVRAALSLVLRNLRDFCR